MTYIQNIINAFRGIPYKVEVEKIVEKEIIKEVIAKRNFLGSIDRADVHYVKGMTADEIKEHKSALTNIYANVAFKRELDAMMDTQVYWMGQQADGDRQHTFGKGTLNGIQLVKERFQDAYGEITTANKPKEKYEDPLERYGILGEFSTPR